MDRSHILIIDDAPLMRDSLQALLNVKGYDAKKCSSGLEALEYVSRYEFDIVLLDIFLPDMDGLQLIDHIKQNNPDSAIIVMTGMPSIESVIIALRKGVYDYLRKPFEPAEIWKTVENALENKKLKILKKQTEEALRSGERLFRDLVENSIVGICIVQNGRIAYMNPEQKKLVGDLPELFEFKDLRIHQEDAKKFEQYCNLINEDKTPSKDIEFRFLPFNTDSPIDSPKWTNCRTNIIEYQGNKAVLINMVDISRSKALENRILIREKFASLGKVAAGLAHEIRNPLTGISLLLDCMAENLDYPDRVKDTKDLLNQAKFAVAKIGSVMKRILNFSKPNECHFEYKDINIPIKETISLSHTALKKLSIDVQLNLADGLPCIYLDAQLIGQALFYLINNALEAMEGQDSKVLRIQSLRERDDIVLKIADSGEGIFPENTEKIFEPFFTTKESGSGIGLSICQRIITDHGGTISTLSSMGNGAEFTIKIPIEKRAINR